MRIDASRLAWLEKAAFLCLLGAIAAVSFSNSFFEIFSSGLIGLTILILILRRDGALFSERWFWSAGFFLALCIVSAFFSVDGWNSAKGVFRVFRSLAMAFSAFYLLRTQDRFCKAYDFFVWVVLFACLDALVQGVTGTEFLRGRTLTPYIYGVGRITGPFHHANDFAAFLTLGLFLCASFLPYALKNLSGRKRLFYAWASALALVCLVWTFARGAWAAVFVTFAALALWRRSWRAALTLVILAGALYAVSPSAVKDRVLSLAEWNNGTVSERRLLWAESLEMMRDKPWFGFGPNTYSEVEPLYKPEGSPTDFQYAHNGYLQIGAETGILGLGSFIFALILFFIQALPVFGRDPGEEIAVRGLAISAGIFAFLIHSATDTNLQSLRLVSLLWIALGMGLAARRLLLKGNK